MCGIAGYLNLDTSCPVDPGILDAMTDCLRHRGPDDRGTHIDGSFGMGFRRLSILDLSSAGHQPMCNEDGTVWVGFNGEIYNFLPLRAELEHRGHIFRSGTDTEVIVHGYETWGIDVLDHLDGMFAVALWDSRRRRLLLARDRFGIKPLRYAILPEAIVFGSEIKALLKNPVVPRDMDPHALWNFLTFAQVPAPETIYRSIRKLLPGHVLIHGDGKTTIRPYYEPPRDRPVDGDVRELASELLSLLDAAVKTHLVADVPVGCFLSGGLDSSLITALAARHMTGRFKTFSVTFEDRPEVDESRYQKIVSELFDTDHHTVRARTNFVSMVPSMLQAPDEPFAISSFMPLYHLAKLTSGHVKVVHSGDGSDELFGGYAARYGADERRLGLGRLCRPLLLWKQGDGIWMNRAPAQRLARRAYLAAASEQERYISSCNWFWAPEKNVLLQPEILRGLDRRYGPHVEAAYDMSLPSSLGRKLRYEFRTSMTDEMLTKIDRATSAFGIEGRVPFLDRAVAEYAWSIRPDRHWSNGVGKMVLKEAARGILPDTIIDRPKAGFTVPLSRWLRNDKAFLRPLLLEPHGEFESYIRPEAVRAMLRAHDRGLGDNGERLWVLYVLKCWMMDASRFG